MADSATQLLLAVTEIQRAFITEQDPAKQFAQTLTCLLEMTGSEYGFIGEVHRDSDGSPWLKTHAITNIAWDEQTRRFYAENVQSGLEFRNLDNLFGEVIKTGQTVLTNSPDTEPSSGGRPEGHPPLKSFLGVPFHSGDELVGMIGIANREDGYTEELVDWLEPLTTTCATMMTAVHAEQERHAAEQALRESEEHFRQIADLTAEVTFEAAIDASGTLRPVAIRGNLPEVLGVPDLAMFGTAWQNCVHPDDLSLVAGLIETARSGETARQVIRWIRPDGETRQLQVSAKAGALSSGGAPTDGFHIVGCIVDVTAAMQSEETLREMVQRHQAILQAVPDLIFLTTRDGQFIEIWAGDESGLLAPSEDLVGQRHRDFLPTEVCDEWDASVIEAESNDEVPSFEYSLDVHGETRWFEARVVACCKKRQAILTVVRDITDRWDAEEAEARQFALLKAISDNSSELIFVKDTERRLLFLNHAAAEMTGLPIEGLVGTTADSVFPEAVSQTIRDNDQQVLQSGRAVTYEETLPGTGGDRVYLTSKTPWRSRSGEILGLIGIAQDITELKETHRELDESRKFVESIADASPHIISVFDVASHEIAYVNRMFEEDLGFTPDDVAHLGEKLLPTLIHPDDLPQIHETLGRLDQARSEDVIEQQCRIRTGSGEWRWFLTRTSVFNRTDDGRLRQIITTSQDITDRVEAQQALQDSEARLRAIIESEPECVKLVARDGTLLEMNSAGLGFTGANSVDDLIGRCVFDLIAPEYEHQFRDFHEKVCAGQPGVLEMEIIGLKGERRRMETHAVPLKYGSAGEIGHLAVTRDVTDMRKTEELVAQQHAQLLHVSRLSSLGQMAGAISHEMTQPLAAISNYAATCRLLLKRSEPDLQAFARHIESISQQAHRAGDTLDRIRSFIRGTDAPKQRCRIDEIINGALELMKAELRNRQAYVSVHAAADLSPVTADCVQIQQVITNLVTNSCDAMQQLPASERQIDISCREDASHVVISVEDTGPGLDDLSQDKLFEAFCTSKSEGMGLGLAICRDIVIAHGGVISAANSPDRGAAFQFTLPVSKEPTDV